MRDALILKELDVLENNGLNSVAIYELLSLEASDTDQENGDEHEGNRNHNMK